MTTPLAGLQLISTIRDNGTLAVVVRPQTLSAPAADEVVIEVQATPLNPSDIGLLFGPADMGQACALPGQTGIEAPVSASALKAMAGRMNQAMPVGNEGAGRVVAAGSDADAQALLGKTVTVISGGMYAQYRLVKAAQCMLLPDGVTPAQGASCFVNPLTALGFVETMKREGHRALVHTAAASNLGQMLNKICQADGIELVNIVRKPSQVALLQGLGARHICDSSAPSFMSDLTESLVATGATLGFDATGGGTLANQILMAMEAALSRQATTYSRYGSSVKKQVYLYGGLDTSATTLNRGYGMAWGVGGWLLPNFLARVGQEVATRLRTRVATEMKTTFASHYTDEISLAEALDADIVAQYNSKSTGKKFLICPQK